MLSNAKSFRPARQLVSVTFAVLAAFSSPMHGQSTQPASPINGGTVDDWSHHRLIYSDPGTERDAIKNGNYSHWWQVVNQSRYAMQQTKRNIGTKTLDETSVGVDVRGARLREEPVAPEVEHLGFEPIEPIGPRRVFPGIPEWLRPVGDLKTDWSEALEVGQVQPNTYPAKFSFTTNTASCTNDFVVYPTGALGSNTKATIVAYNELYGTSGPSGTGCGAPASPTIAVPTVLWAFNTGAATVSTSPVISYDATGSKVAFLQYNGTTTSLVVVKWAASPATSTFTGTLNGTTSVTVTAGTVTSADVGAQVSAATDIPTGDTITAVSGSTVTLATAATGSATGVTLTIHAETLALPGVPPTSTNIAGCTAPCMSVTSLGAAVVDAYSSPFYDYEADDALYVGDNSGHLYQVLGVFNGTTAPTVNTITLTGSTYHVASPVFDSISGCVFVGDSQGYLYSVNSGRGGTVCTGGSFSNFGHSEILGNGAANEGIFDAPLVDPSTEQVYAFVTDSAAIGKCAAAHNCVAQFAAGTITSGSITAAPNAAEPIGTGVASANLYAGTFDNVYYQSASTPPSGNLWAVGNVGAEASAILYDIPVVSSTFVGTTHSNTSVTVTSGTVTASDVGAPITGSNIPAGTYITAFTSPTVTLSAAASSSTTGITFTIAGIGTPTSALTALSNTSGFSYPWASPATEFCNPGASAACALNAGGTETATGTDYLFFSLYRGTPTGCTNSSTNGCYFSYIISNGSVSAPTLSGAVNETGSVASPGCWATGGFIIDNDVQSGTEAGASEMYFIDLTNAAGGPSVGTYTSSLCTTGDTSTINGIQARQNTP